MSAATQAERSASWAERGATATIFLTLGLLVGAWAAALPGLKLKLGLTTGELSIALFALSIGSVVASLVSGVVMPRLGTGRATGVAALALLGTFSLTPFAGSLAAFVATTVTVGLAIGVLEVAVNGHAGDIEHRWGGPIMSSFHGGFSLGGLIGSALGGFIIGSGLDLTAQILIPVVLATMLTLGALPSLGNGHVSEAAAGGLAWPGRKLLGLCVVVMSCYIIEGAMADWSAVYLASVTGSSLALAAMGYAAFSVTMTAGRLGGDLVMGRLGPRLLVGAGGCLAALGLAVAVVIAQPAVAMFGFALVGIGAANIVPAVTTAAARAGQSPASGIAVVTTVGYAGFLSGPPLIGAIASASSLRIALAVLVVAAATSGLTGWLVFGRKATA